jgi:hypothetical protein
MRERRITRRYAPQPDHGIGHGLYHHARLGSSPFARRYSGNLV